MIYLLNMVIAIANCQFTRGQLIYLLTFDDYSYVYIYIYRDMKIIQ